MEEKKRGTWKGKTRGRSSLHCCGIRGREEDGGNERVNEENEKKEAGRY